MTLQSGTKQCFLHLSIALIACIVSACGGGTSNESNTVTPPTVVLPPSPTPTPSPPTTPNDSAPTISLIGNKLVLVPLGQTYVDEGIIAMDMEDGDISLAVSVQGEVNDQVIGDYLLRFQITDSAGNTSGVIRIVRVIGASSPRQTRRPNQLTGANLSYLEHLPTDYGMPGNLTPPLIIFNHGSGATGAGNLTAVECCGLPLVLRQNGWDNTRPFIILSPQRTSGLDTTALNNFIDYAIRTYNVDTDRIYMAGWSQGANISLRYIINYPNKVAAVAALAGGLFQGIPSNICNAGNEVPLWTFLGNQDAKLINDAGTSTTNAFNNCGPLVPAKLSVYTSADHFATSNWPFQPEQTHQLTVDSDPVRPSLFDWFLTFSNE